MMEAFVIWVLVVMFAWLVIITLIVLNMPSREDLKELRTNTVNMLYHSIREQKIGIATEDDDSYPYF